MASPTGLLSEGLISNPAPSFQQPPQLQNNPAAVLCEKGPETRFIESSPLPSASSFRNVSACHRCRMRKHRCDQQLPKCQSCEKAQVRCVGYDPITKKEIPRSYVYFLETRVQYLNDILLKHNIDFNIGAASDDGGPNIEATTTAMLTSPVKTEISNSSDRIPGDIPRNIAPAQLDNSLDCVIFDLLAGKETKEEITRMDDSNGFPTSLSTSLHSPLFRFGIESPAKEYMELPDRDIADQLVDEYFIHTNLHVPVLNRPDFERNLNRIYSNKKTNHPKDKLFFVFIVLAIGAASVSRTHHLTSSSGSNFDRSGVRSKKRKRPSIHLQAADEFHASAMACWENCLDSHGNLGLFGDFDGLQAVILLCSFALFKSTSPGLGKLLDIAIRTAIDLRLYSEDENSITNLMKFDSKSPINEVHCDWVQDLRRRLWWCIYSLDRLVAPYLERPFFIPDDVITTKFPSVLDDRFITRCGILTSVGDSSAYKPTVQHRFKFRILQSEIHTVIQYQQSLSRRGGVLQKCNRKLPSYMTGFSSFSSWRHNMYCRLQDWRKSMPTFGPLSDRFLMELDFWQSIIALYRWSVKIPTDLVQARAMNNVTTQSYFDETQEEAEFICFKVAEASSNALHIHHMMQNIGNATAPYLTAHEVFVAGRSPNISAFGNSKIG